MKLYWIVILAALLALGGGFITRALNSSNEADNSSQIPSFTLNDASGKSRNIDEWQGKVRIINFWATWCPPCIKEIPEFVALQEQYANKGLQFIGVAVDDEESVTAYLAKMKINYPILIGDIEGIALAHQLGNSVDAVPYTLVVDKQGKIIHQHRGGISKEQIMEVISPILD
jgi:thiol-disulfide isomerase/thioredoxin